MAMGIPVLCDRILSPPGSPSALTSPPHHLLQQPRDQRMIEGALAATKRRQKVAVFWDLDNKPPPPKAQPFDVAMELKNVAAELGHVEEVAAYANKHAFAFVPVWVKEARERRELLDQLELRGSVVPDKPYVCLICNQKFRINLDLMHHLLSYHEPERRRRLHMLKKLKDAPLIERRALECKEQVYMEATRGVLIPAVGYGLEYELRRAGVYVRTVPDDPQATDRALKRRMRQAIKSRLVDCILLVSDDSDYSEVLLAARSNNICTAMLAETITLGKSADIMLSWPGIVSGDARTEAIKAAREWIARKTEEDSREKTN